MGLSWIKKQFRLAKRGRGSKGFTLLEYCAGAAVIAGMVFASLNTFGTNLGGLLTELGNWATRRADEVKTH
jgi:hypothetical protein